MKPVRLTTINSETSTMHLARAITRNWLIGLRETNPAILDMFAERDILPYRDLLLWSGEFAGKYITGAYYIYRSTLDPELYSYMIGFLDEMISYQDEDGYMGCYDRNRHITGEWDAWAHYHSMFGLLLWYNETGDRRYLETVEKAAGLFMNLFYRDSGRKLSEIGWTEMNLAPLHVFTLLYEQTGKKAYLTFAKSIEGDFATADAGNYVECALNGIEFYQCPKPRWESLHPIMGIAELYRATGTQYYLDAAAFIFYSILKTDVHNTGGFSTREQAVGNPYQDGPIESCCVIAYNALAVEIYKLTRDPKILDFLELSHYNACMGMRSPTGRWSTYDTPMHGCRKANFHDINFQDRPGSPELNCCSVNAARSIGNLSEWRFTRDDDTLYINFWEKGEYVTEDGIRICMEGNYPADGNITCSVSGYSGKLALRVPEWSKHTEITLQGRKQNMESGYYRLSCNFELHFTLSLDLSVRIMAGDGDQKGNSCVYRGPILFGVDTTGVRSGNLDIPETYSAKEICSAPLMETKGKYHLLLPDGTKLTDFYHLGYSGGQYKTWLNISKE